jgi:hypothetical protein
VTVEDIWAKKELIPAPIPDLNLLDLRAASREVLAQRVALLQQERLGLSRDQVVLSNIESISDPEDEGVALVCRKCDWNSGFTLGYSLTDQAELVRQRHVPQPECLITSDKEDAGSHNR